MICHNWYEIKFERFTSNSTWQKLRKKVDAFYAFSILYMLKNVHNRTRWIILWQKCLVFKTSLFRQKLGFNLTETDPLLLSIISHVPMLRDYLLYKHHVFPGCKHFSVFFSLAIFNENKIIWNLTFGANIVKKVFLHFRLG